jgi:hypothetical protein
VEKEAGRFRRHRLRIEHKHIDKSHRYNYWTTGAVAKYEIWIVDPGLSAVFITMELFGGITYPE